MATILEFRVPPGFKHHPGEAQQAGTVNIVIFPGVRYEHWDEAPQRPPRKRGKAKRDTLQNGE